MSKTAKRITLGITDGNGRMVLQKQVDLIAGTNLLPLDMKAIKKLAPGIYYLRANGLEYTKAKDILVIDQ